MWKILAPSNSSLLQVRCNDSSVSSTSRMVSFKSKCLCYTIFDKRQPNTIVAQAIVLISRSTLAFFSLCLSFHSATQRQLLNASLLLVLFGWIGRICYERRFEWKRTPLDIPIAVFLLLALVASLLAPHPATSSLGYFWKLLRAVLLFYAVVHSRLGSRWRHLIIAFVFAGWSLLYPRSILLRNRHTHGNCLYVRRGSKVRKSF